jgi:hypothetical protein
MSQQYESLNVIGYKWSNFAKAANPIISWHNANTEKDCSIIITVLGDDGD